MQNLFLELIRLTGGRGRYRFMFKNTIFSDRIDGQPFFAYFPASAKLENTQICCIFVS